MSFGSPVEVPAMSIDARLGSTLVTGGAGFIGSHLADALVHVSDSVTVYDDLS